MMGSMCPFCDPKQNYRFLMEKKLVRALYAKNPACRYHVLIVPKRHIKHIDELTDGEWAEFLDIVKTMDMTMRSLEEYIGYNLLSNNGDERIRQRVDHCHIHMFLRTKDEQDDPLISKHSPFGKDLTAAERASMLKLKQLLIKTSAPPVTME